MSASERTSLRGAKAATAARGPLLRLQRQCACGAGKSSLAEDCEDCRKKKLVGAQAKLAIGAPGDRFEHEADRVADQVMAHRAGTPAATAPVRVQRVDAGGGGAAGLGEAPPEVHAVIDGPGHALDPGTRGFFESRFGHDFSRVRVHNDAAADRSARAVGAHAYTVGRHLVFAQGRYQPGSDGGRRLLAHELTHTLQQSEGGAAPALQRASACTHDGQETRCRADVGVIKLRDAAGKVGLMFSIDRWIADEGLAARFPGSWVSQLQTPANPLKTGEDRGAADAVRVNDSGALGLEIAEIKARSPDGGGCALATSEALGYASVIKPIKPQILAISAGLARQGGVRSRRGCTDPHAPDRKKLVAAGVDFDNATSMQAWCLIHSLQEKLNKTYTQAFTDLTVGTFDGGDKTQTYDMWPPMRIDCPPKKGKRRPGWTFLGFQVNGKGGVSYGCTDRCYDSDEEEQRKTQELVKEDEARRKKQAAPRQSVPSGMHLDDSDRPDTGEKETPVNLPEGGISVTDAIAAGGAAVVTLATLHQAAKVLKGRELAAAREAAAKALAQARAKGAIDVARKLNSARLTKEFGTKAYDKTVAQVASKLEQEALKDAGFMAKHGAKAARFLGRAAAVLGVLMLAKDAAAAVSHISKGGTIDIGLSGMDASLKGDTDIKTQGPTGAQDVKGDVTLKDTQIDIETTGFPSVSGQVDLQAEKLTIRGRVGDGPATVSFTGRFKNTTITIRHSGEVKNGKLRMEGGSEISDAEIEIDLQGADLSRPRDPGTATVIKGGKIRITEAGSGGGGGGAGSSTGQKGTPGTSGGQAPVQAPPGQGGTGTQGSGAKQGAADDIAELVREVQGSPGLRTLYAGLIGKDDGVPVTAEMLRRLVAIKSSLERHPGVVQEILQGLKPAQITDAIKQVIEPIEARVRQADRKLAKAREDAIADAKKPKGGKPQGQKPQPDKPAEPPKDTGDKDTGDKGEGKKGGQGGKGGADSGIDPADVRELRLEDLFPVLERPGQGTSDNTPPKTMDYVLVWRVKLDQSELVYNIGVELSFLRHEKAAAGELWSATYTFKAPTGVIVDSTGGMPIRFTDTGTLTALIVTRPPPKKKDTP